jgi:methylenetetrahydrofolate reductase (NADPH)
MSLHAGPGGARGAGACRISFEFFPPKTPEMEQTLWASIQRLEPLGPQFVSVTYGAGGSTRERTQATVGRILRETRLVPAAHLTCVGAIRGEVDEVIRAYRDLGVRHIVAIRGDLPGDAGGPYRPHPGGYRNAADLVRGIRAIGDFEISVSAFPEKHPESPSLEIDLALLAEKVDNGASRAITQFFFDNSAYFRYLDRARARGIEIPIVPGIVPIGNFARICTFAARCGTAIPRWLAARFDGLDADPAAHQRVATAVAAEQVAGLREQGVSQFHFYTLNRAELVCAVCRLLGLGRVATDAAA